MKILGVFLGLVGLFSSAVGLSELAQSELNALEETKKVLLDPTLLDDAAKKNPGGKEALAQVNKIAGSAENQQLIMELAAEIMEALTVEAKGNPEKMLMNLQQFQKDPASLEKKLTPAQRQKLREIASKIESKGKMP